MPSGTLAPRPRWYETDADGNPLAGGKIAFFQAGTTTPLDTFADRALTIANTNPVILDAAGRAAVFFSARTYRVVVSDANDVQQYDQDDCQAYQGVGGSSGLDEPITAGQDLAANDLAYISDGSGGLTQGRAYKADAALAYASIDAKVGFVTAAILSGASGFLRSAGSMDGFTALTAGSTYYASTVVGAITATPPANARSIGVAISATTILIEQSPRRPDLINALICQGRLTLTTGVPVTTADVTAATTLRFAPYGGNRADLFDGTRWNRRTFTELSIALPAVASQLYDVFLVDTSGVLSLELNAWRGSGQAITGATNATPIVITAVAHGLSNGDEVYVASVGGNTAANGKWIVANKAADTFELTGSVGNAGYTAATGFFSARASTGILTTQDGVLVKTGALTRRYLGTCRTTTAAGQTEDSGLKRLVWNYYHRKPRPLFRVESTGSWTYSTATYRQANAASANQVAFVIGIMEDPVEMSLIASVANGAAAVAVAVAIGLNSTTTPALNQLTGYANSPSANNLFVVSARYLALIVPGFHTLTWLEISAATPTTTWYGANGAGFANQSGLNGSVMA